MSEEILFCPYCGKTDILRVETAELLGYFANVGYAVICPVTDGGCGASSIFAETEAAAITAWNTRFQAEPRALTETELREYDGERIYIQYIGNCEGFYANVFAPYYGKYEQYVSEYNGMIRATDLPLQYYGKSWLAYDRQPKED